MGLGRLEMYQAAPAATAAKAARVAGSDRKFTRALLPSAMIDPGKLVEWRLINPRAQLRK